MTLKSSNRIILHEQGRYMAVDFAADLQQELDYFAGPLGMGVDGFYIDCTRTSAEWLLSRCASHRPVLKGGPHNLHGF